MFDIYGNMKEPPVSEPLKVRKQLYGKVAKYHGEVFHELARHQESRILEGHLCPDHVHMLIAIPPKLRWTAEKFYGAKFLGSRILRVNDWSE